MWRRAPSIPLVLSALLLGCGSPELQLASQENPITDGQTYSGHPSVGMLVTGYGGLCTATLVGQKTVLTAAHCVQPGSSHTFKVGGGSYPASSVHRHPSYQGEGGSNDIAVVRLSSAPPVAPSKIAVSEPSVGTEITLIGYGVTYCTVTAYGQVSCSNDSGIKRIAKNKIAQRSSVEFTFVGTGGGMGSTCKGDSGGPAFATLFGHEVVVGVTSRGEMPCGKQAIDTRVDVFATWVEQTAGGDVDKGSTTPPDTEAPSVVITSPAAGATVQESLTVKAQVTDNQGVARVELTVDGAVQASLTQGPFEFPVTLAPGQHTLRVVGHDAAGNQGEALASVTVATDPGPGGPTDPGPDPVDPTPAPAPGTYGASCTGNADCTSGLCAEDPGFSGRFCTQECDPLTDGACPGGGVCLPTNVADKHVCSAPESSVPRGAPGGQLLGGCSLASPAGSGSPAVAGLLLLGLLGLLRRR